MPSYTEIMLRQFDRIVEQERQRFEQETQDKSYRMFCDEISIYDCSRFANSEWTASVDL